MMHTNVISSTSTSDAESTVSAAGNSVVFSESTTTTVGDVSSVSQLQQDSMTTTRHQSLRGPGQCACYLWSVKAGCVKQQRATSRSRLTISTETHNTHSSLTICTLHNSLLFTTSTHWFAINTEYKFRPYLLPILR